MACEDEVSWLCCMSTKLSHWWGWPASHYCRLGQTNDCVKQEIFICIRSFKPLYLAEPLTSWLTSLSLCIMASLHASFINIGRVQALMINLTKAVWYTQNGLVKAHNLNLLVCFLWSSHLTNPVLLFLVCLRFVVGSVIPCRALFSHADLLSL